MNFSALGEAVAEEYLPLLAALSFRDAARIIGKHEAFRHNACTTEDKVALVFQYDGQVRVFFMNRNDRETLEFVGFKVYCVVNAYGQIELENG